MWISLSSRQCTECSALGVVYSVQSFTEVWMSLGKGQGCAKHAVLLELYIRDDQIQEGVHAEGCVRGRINLCLVRSCLLVCSNLISAPADVYMKECPEGLSSVARRALSAEAGSRQRGRFSLWSLFDLSVIVLHCADKAWSFFSSDQEYEDWSSAQCRRPITSRGCFHSREINIENHSLGRSQTDLQADRQVPHVKEKLLLWRLQLPAAS